MKYLNIEKRLLLIMLNNCINLALITLLILFPFSCGKSGGRVSIGSKSFTEQYIVGSMLALLLEKNGIRVREKFGTGSMITRKGLETGQIDLYAEYTGTAWTLYMKHREKVHNPMELYEKVMRKDLKDHKLVWLPPTSINNTYAMAIRQDDVQKFGKSLSDLARYMNSHTDMILFGIAHEFFERPDGFRKMAEHYKMKIKENNIKTMDIGLTFESISRKQIDVAMVFSTDGKLKKYNLFVLEDDKGFFPVYSLCFVIRKETLKQYPEIKSILSPLSNLLNNTVMQELNYRVDAEGKPAKLVADDFLKENGLL